MASNITRPVTNPRNSKLRRLQKNRCYLCGEEFGFAPNGTPNRRALNNARRISADHVRPKASGADLMENKLLAHARCNSDKGDRDPRPCEMIYLSAIYDRFRAPPPDPRQMTVKPNPSSHKENVMTLELGTVLEELQASEINAGVQSFWHKNWTAWIGDDLNGRRAEESFIDLAEAVAWLDAEARRQYPASDFARLTA